MAHVVVKEVGVVHVVVNRTIAEPIGVGIVRAEVTWVSCKSVACATRSNHAAFSFLTSAAKKVTTFLSSDMLLKLRAKSSAVGT